MKSNTTNSTSTTSSNTTAETLYRAYPADLAAIAQHGEDTLTQELSQSDALRLELPEDLLRYRQIALARLRAVTLYTPAPTDAGDFDAAAAHAYLQVQFDKEITVLVANATARVQSMQRNADNHLKDYIGTLRHRNRFAALHAQRTGGTPR